MALGGVVSAAPQRQVRAAARQEQRVILAEHGAIGMAYGAGDFAHDVRLACHGLDKHDNDFVIGLVGKELFPLSHVVQSMRKTQQTSLYLERLGPFFVGRAIWQSALASATLAASTAWQRARRRDRRRRMRLSDWLLCCVSACCDERFDVRGRTRTRRAGDFLAAGEHRHRRNRSDPEALAEIGQDVGVDLDDEQPAGGRAASFSSSGATIRQGPHHGAQKSTTTGSDA